MKNILLKISAIMLVIWYSLSVIGFDVHTCSGSGRIFIATVLGGTSCEDIHPEQGKTHCNCCHKTACKKHSEDESVRTKPCCTDDWQVISITGVRGSDDQRINFSFDHMCHPVLSCAMAVVNSSLSSIRAVSGHCLKDFVSTDFQKAYHIWRI